MQDNTIKRIHSKGDYRHEEELADAGISPGHLLELTATGVKVHATANGGAEALFAGEDALQGRTVSTAYVATELVSCLLPVKGAVVNAMLEAGQAFTKGQKLASAGDGTLQPWTTGVIALAVCEKALDLSGTGAVDTLSPVRII